MAEISIFYGSVYGAAERLADTAQEKLNELGHQAEVIDNPQVQDMLDAKSILVVTSTTGQGDIPDNLVPLFISLQTQFPMLTAKPFAVLAMGDSSYGETFCGAGRQFDELLQELQATQVQPRLEVDALEHFEPEPVALPWLQSLSDQLG